MSSTIRRMSLVGSLVCVACVATGGAQVREVDGRRLFTQAPKTRSSLPDCLVSCETLDCQRGCVQRRVEQLASSRATEEKALLVLDDATAEAMANLRFCAAHYLDVEPRNPLAFGTCVWAASRVLLGRIGWETDSMILQSDARENILRVLSQIHDIAFLAVRAQEGSAATTVQNEGKALGYAMTDLGATAAQDGGEQPKQEKPTFETCIKDLDANKDFCEQRYPTDSAGLKDCLDAAKFALNECLKRIYAL